MVSMSRKIDRAQAVKEPVLHVLDAVVQGIDDGEVALDQRQADPVQQEAERLRLDHLRVRAQTRTDRLERRERFVVDGDEVTGADEDGDLTQTKPRPVVESGGEENDQAARLVLVDLRPLVRRSDVFDGERVQRQLLLEVVDLGAGRTRQVDPDQAARLL